MEAMICDSQVASGMQSVEGVHGVVEGADNGFFRLLIVRDALVHVVGETVIVELAQKRGVGLMVILRANEALLIVVGLLLKRNDAVAHLLHLRLARLCGIDFWG